MINEIGKNMWTKKLEYSKKLGYIIRLYDANPKMNPDGWDRIERILDKYNVKPIVGVIPDCKDELFVWNYDNCFWDKVLEWQHKGWTIAQHGYNHVYHDCGNNIHSEFIGLSYNEQKEIIEKGFNVLMDHGVKATCFFAPGHTFDNITVQVCRDSKRFDFISDGYALYPFRRDEMLFLPSIFDTARKFLPFGIYTFILHPSFTTEKEFEHFESFIKRNQAYFMSASDVLALSDWKDNRSLLDKLIEQSILLVRKIKICLNNN